MQGAARFIENNLPTFKKAWHFLNNFIYAVFWKGPIYTVSLLLVLALIVLSQKYIKWNTIGRSWLDNSTSLMINESEENLIFKAVLQHVDSKQCGVNCHIYVLESTWYGSKDIEFMARTSALPCISFKNVNKNPRKFLQSDLDVENLRHKTKFIILSDQEFNETFNGDLEGWDNFHTKYPSAKGIVHLSRPGINIYHNMAMVVLGIQFDWLAGHGALYEIRKINGTWSVDKIYPMWIS